MTDLPFASMGDLGLDRRKVTQCAEAALAVWAGERSAALGQSCEPEAWALVTTSGFEYTRPAGDSDDRRSLFSPSSVISTQVMRG